LGGALAFSVGALMALMQGGTARLEMFVLGYAIVLFGDLSTHFSNDYFDVEVDKYSAKKKFFGGSKILVSNPRLRLLSRNISVALLVSSNVLAVISVFFFGAPIELFVIMLGANFLGWFYSAPPLRLISRGFGEIAVAWVTGFVIPGVGYLAVRNQFDSVFLYLSVPFMMYGFVLSLSLHLPDSKIDQIGDKKTLAVHLGPHAVVRLILTAVMFASLILLAYYLCRIPAALNLGVIFVLSTLPSVMVFFGFVRFWKKGQVANFAASNIASLFMFNLLMTVYLIMSTSSIA
jgi:1,4-dihydroxy-2-naphthoate octaprenyltransferase